MLRRNLLGGASAFSALVAARSARAAVGGSRSHQIVALSRNYVGPGNFATAIAPYMLRGYSSQTANIAQCVNLRRSSDNATQDFGLLNGNLRQSLIAAWGGVNAVGTGSITGAALTFTGGVIGGQVTPAAPGTLIISGTSPNWTVNISQTVASTTLTVANALFPTVLYNQLTPGANDAVQATAGNQPYLALNAVNGRAAIWFTNNSAFRLQAASLPNPWATGGWAVDTFFVQTLPSLTNGLFGANTLNDPGLSVTATGLMTWAQNASTTNGSWTTAFSLSAATGYVLDVSYSQSSNANNPTITVNGSVKSTTPTNPTGTITAVNGVSLGNTPAASRSVPAFHTEWIFYNNIPAAGTQEAIRLNSGAYYGIPIV